MHPCSPCPAGTRPDKSPSCPVTPVIKAVFCQAASPAIARGAGNRPNPGCQRRKMAGHAGCMGHAIFHVQISIGPRHLRRSRRLQRRVEDRQPDLAQAGDGLAGRHLDGWPVRREVSSTLLVASPRGPTVMRQAGRSGPWWRISPRAHPGRRKADPDPRLQVAVKRLAGICRSRDRPVSD